VAGLLAYESRARIMGESADSDFVLSVRRIATSEPSVQAVPKLLTMQLGPHRRAAGGKGRHELCDGDQEIRRYSSVNCDGAFA
jgi:hypothetical protein